VLVDFPQTPWDTTKTNKWHLIWTYVFLQIVDVLFHNCNVPNVYWIGWCRMFIVKQLIMLIVELACACVWHSSESCMFLTSRDVVVCSRWLWVDCNFASYECISSWNCLLVTLHISVRSVFHSMFKAVRIASCACTKSRRHAVNQGAPCWVIIEDVRACFV
jgi:hypothetical protein